MVRWGRGRREGRGAAAAAADAAAGLGGGDAGAGRRGLVGKGEECRLWVLFTRCPQQLLHSWLDAEAISRMQLGLSKPKICLIEGIAILEMDLVA